MRRVMFCMLLIIILLPSCNENASLKHKDFEKESLTHNDSIVEGQVKMYRDNIIRIIEIKNRLETIEIKDSLTIYEANELLKTAYEFHRQYALLLSEVYATRMIYSNEVSDALLMHNIHIDRPDMFANFMIEMDSLFYKETSFEGSALSQMYYKYLIDIQDTIGLSN